jgi:hypothetical protein
MAFRVETTAPADEDADSILEWLVSQHAGETGIRWFLALEDAIASLANLPHRCPLLLKMRNFPSRCANCFTAGNRMFTGFYSPSRTARYTSSTSVMAAAGLCPNADPFAGASRSCEF